MAQDFLHQRHAAYRTSERDLFDLIRKATGQEASESTRIAQGYDNEVYAVRTQQGDDFILRLRQHGEVSFEQEAWAIAQCRTVGVPVPEILFVATVLIEEQPREAMVQRTLAGTPLSTILRSLATSEQAALFAQAGEALRGIHSIAVGGFWRRHDDGTWDWPNWEQLMQSHLDNRRAERPFLVQSGFTETEIETLYEMMERYQQEAAGRKPILCHGDFLPAHLFVTDDLRLSGVIDFGEFHGGTPLDDFALLYMEHPEVNLAWVQSGYGKADFFQETFPSHLLMHCVGKQVGYLAHYQEQGINDEAASAIKALRRILQEWKQLETGQTHG